MTFLPRDPRPRRVLLRGGPILTSELGSGPATAMGIEGGTIRFVGSAAEAETWAAGADEIVELAGRLVTPAFVDAHVHLSQTGLRLSGLDLAAATSRTDVLDAVARHARARADAVLLGFGWDETTWADPRLPTAAELDRAAPGRPVYLARVDVHSGLVSGALYDRAPAMAAEPGWDGTGRVEREAHHVARDAAAALVTDAQRTAAIEAALAAAAAAGLGGLHEMSAPHVNAADDLAVCARIAAVRPSVRVVTYWGELARTGGVDRALELGCRGAAGDLCADGAFGSRTAALTSPYADLPGHTGHGYLDADEVAAHVVACTEAGLQAGFHCIGDAAVTAVVEGLRLAEKRIGADRLSSVRHRLEHVELVTAEQAHDLARWGVVVSGQPAFDAAWGGTDGMYATRLGTDRALAANPWATLRRAGVALAFGSDAPVTPFDPWGGVRAAAWHHNETERIGVADAFAAHTRGGHHAAGDENGVLAPGAEATYAVWDGATDASGRVTGDAGLPDLRPGTPLPTCVRTVVAGEAVFDREQPHWERQDREQA
ncbi:amidohydrolase family protein [Actinopolymorpha sp. NPDC004070]|uniref:amidohydrolase n=1 Tax=Actinopolymorpha sp. NPDC004070 TaxID=3154548 RepID=UPI0033A8B56D